MPSPESCPTRRRWLGQALAATALAVPTLRPARAQSTAGGSTAAPACPALLAHTFARLQDDKPQPLCQYAGRVLLVVNTASYCGYTGQYQGLEALHARYAARGLAVLGFPSNDFGQQEPGDAKQIADFCFNTYGVRFPMFAKSRVVGAEANALYRALAQASGQAPRWNFHKYLVDRSAQTVQSFPSAMAPDDPALVKRIEQALAAG